MDRELTYSIKSMENKIEIFLDLFRTEMNPLRKETWFEAWKDAEMMLSELLSIRATKSV